MQSRISIKFRTALVFVLLLSSKLALAFSYSCSTASLSSTFPAKLAVSTTENANAFWTGTITVTQSNCKNNSTDGNTTPATFLATNSSGKALSAAPGILFSVNGTPTATVTAGPCTFNSYSTFSGNNGPYAWIYWNHPLGATCSFQTVFPVALFMNTSLGGITGSVGANITSETGNIGGAPGWAWYSGNGSDLPLSSSFTIVSTACTLSTSNVVVSLPKVASGSLNVPGKTAGRTAFTLTLSGCTNIGASYVADATWSYAQAGSLSNVIANGASTSPAANIGVQILDSNLNPVTDFTATTLATISSAGNYSTTYYAQYYATGVGGAGNVTGLAQLLISYQ